jgi:hypothetical protein
MDARAAKGIAANIRDIAISATRVALIESGALPNESPAEYQERITKAEARIAQWLQQPMTWR